ncbi:MAG: class I SAM-dependent methyltransferase [Roseburia sp.]|nr:class I SAM-dependent methyltransferase [Roseburia sp.]
MMQGKDWTGNRASVYAVLGASSHSAGARAQDDYYATEPRAMELLLAEEAFAPAVWECACGEGHLSRVLEAHGHKVVSTDLVYRGYGEPEPVDFLKAEGGFDGDIITNPPYKYALEFVEKALGMVGPGRKVAMFLKLQFLEGKGRKWLFLESPPRTVYVSSSRLGCAKNGDFVRMPSSAVAYAWFVWEKGFAGDPAIRWIN